MPKYNSQELDTETGYYFYNARHYDPVICRFVTADSVVDGELSPMGWNRYMYVHGNPIRYMDPTGHFSKGILYTSSYEGHFEKILIGVQTMRVDKGDEFHELVEQRVKKLKAQGIKTNYKKENARLRKWNSHIKDFDKLRKGERLITDIVSYRKKTNLGKVLKYAPNFEVTGSTCLAVKSPLTGVGYGIQISASAKADFDKESGGSLDIQVVGGWDPDTKASINAGVSFGEGDPNHVLGATYKKINGEVDWGKDRFGIKVGISSDPYSVYYAKPIPRNNTNVAKKFYNLRNAERALFEAYKKQFIAKIRKYHLKKEFYNIHKAPK